MRRRVEQDLMLVLSVEVHELTRELPQGGARGERAVEERPAPPLRGDLAPENDFTAVAAVEDRLDSCRLFARPHEVARRAPPDEQPDSTYEDRLARPGFAREHGQARLELELEVVDHGQISNGKEPQHGRPSAILSDV